MYHIFWPDSFKVVFVDSAGVDNSVVNHSYLAYTRLWCDSSILPLSETRLLRSLSYEAFKPAIFWMAAFCKQGLNSKWRLPFYFQKDPYDWDDHKMLSHRSAFFQQTQTCLSMVGLVVCGVFFFPACFTSITMKIWNIFRLLEQDSLRFLFIWGRKAAGVQSGNNAL